MSLYKTNTFWNYIINESPQKIIRCKEILTKKTYNYDLGDYQQDIYYQEFKFLNGYSFLRFPCGLTQYLCNNIYIEVAQLDTLDEKYTYDQLNVIAQGVSNINPNYEVRDYQINAVLASLNRFESLIQAATGSGKTSMIALVCKVLFDKKILILNGNNLILQQIFDRIRSFGISDISWNPSKEPDYSKRIVLINTSTSDSRLNDLNKEYIEFLNTVETVIWDEAHHIQALTSFEPIFYTNLDKLKHIIGYTASPFRNYLKPYDNADDFRTIAILGEPVFQYALKDSIADNNVAQPYSYFINFPNRQAFVPSQFKNNYYMQYRMNITYNKARNKAGLEMLKFLNKHNVKTLASFNNIKPGQKMMKNLKEEGINSLFICGNNTIYEWVYTSKGKLKLESRNGDTETIKNALLNDYNIIFGSTVLDEGVDIDIFQAAVLFSAGRTPIAGLQRIGRASRKKKNGKNISFVIDFKDVNGNYIFNEQYLARKKMMDDSGIKNIVNVYDFIKMIEELKDS